MRVNACAREMLTKSHNSYNGQNFKFTSALFIMHRCYGFGNNHRKNIGTFTNGPFNPREDPIGAMINFVGCAPGNEETTPNSHRFITYIVLSYALVGYCFCKDNPEEELDVRPQFFRAIQDLCPRHKLDRSFT